MSKNKYPTNKEMICLIGMGVLLTGTILFPGLGMAARYIHKKKIRYERENLQKEWKRFNLRLLKRNIRRLQEQEIVEIVEENGQEIVKLTKKGNVKYLSFKLEDLFLKSNSWDGKWRVVIYDIGKLKNFARDSLRSILKKIKFLQLQKSVYLTPYKCDYEIKYLKEYFGVGDEVMILEVSKLENEKYYKEYFGI